ncbi:MAG: hypothetical protein KF761_07250 [Salinibacterium sp.]|nr:hypothetical protein [Salinibacterium sp.]
MTDVSLNGLWRLGWYDGRRGDRAFRGLHEQNNWLEATVPGEIHADLERQGVIQPIAPGLGALAARWIEDSVWYFERDFDLDAAALTDSAELVFGRLELDAAVFVNDTLVARHRTAFRPLRVQVREHLVAGRNVVRVELDGGLQAVSDLPAKGYSFDKAQRLTKRHWLRTGQSQFMWDWSPRLVTIGITGDVALELHDDVARIDEVVPLIAIAEDRSSATVTCRVHLSGIRSGTVSVGIPELAVSAAAEVESGAEVVELVLNIADPELWWPVGMGEQPLFDLTATLDVSGRMRDSRTRQIGLRSIVVDQSPAPDDGTLFRIFVNGLPFFAKGANWVPISLAPNPVDQQLLDRQLDRALEANFNFLRVWGGGDYETEEFYSGCDRRGILVWQDFIFAVSRYPFSVPEFAEEVSSEAVHQVRRLSSHASLAIWAGNNEIGWLGSFAVWPGPLVPAEDGVTLEQVRADHGFFENELREIVEANDGTRFYQPSSPWSDNSADHNDFHQGDQHPWEVGFDEVNFLLYRKMDARFPNEGGMLGPSSLPSLLASLPEGQREFESFAWKVHENEVMAVHAHRPLHALVEKWTGVRLAEVSLPEYAYWGGLIQSEALMEYIDNFRRRPATGAAVFWMFNDCWPTVRSWSIVDWEGRRSPAFAAVGRAFAPVRVAIVERPDGASVHVTNDRPDVLSLELEWGSATLDGSVSTQRRVVEVPALSTVEVEQMPALADPLGTAYIATLREGDAILSRDRLLGGPFAALPWLPANVRAEHGVGVSTFVSDVFVLGVCLDLDGERMLSDNFFDLYPGVPYSVSWDGSEPPTVLFTGNVSAPA